MFGDMVAAHHAFDFVYRVYLAAVGLALGHEEVFVRFHLLELLLDFIPRGGVHEHAGCASVLRDDDRAARFARLRDVSREVRAELAERENVLVCVDVVAPNGSVLVN